MNSDVPINLNHHYLLQISPEATDFELEVMRWFADGHEILWIPIYEATDEPTGLADAKADMAPFWWPTADS